MIPNINSDLWITGTDWAKRTAQLPNREKFYRLCRTLDFQTGETVPNHAPCGADRARRGMYGPCPFVHPEDLEWNDIRRAMGFHVPPPVVASQNTSSAARRLSFDSSGMSMSRRYSGDAGPSGSSQMPSYMMVQPGTPSDAMPNEPLPPLFTQPSAISKQLTSILTDPGVLALLQRVESMPVGGNQSTEFSGAAPSRFGGDSPHLSTNEPSIYPQPHLVPIDTDLPTPTDSEPSTIPPMSASASSSRDPRKQRLKRRPTPKEEKPFKESEDSKSTEIFSPPTPSSTSRDVERAWKECIKMLGTFYVQDSRIKNRKEAQEELQSLDAYLGSSSTEATTVDLFGQQITEIEREQDDYVRRWDEKTSGLWPFEPAEGRLIPPREHQAILTAELKSMQSELVVLTDFLSAVQQDVQLLEEFASKAPKELVQTRKRAATVDEAHSSDSDVPLASRWKTKSPGPSPSTSKLPYASGDSGSVPEARKLLERRLKQYAELERKAKGLQTQVDDWVADITESILQVAPEPETTGDDAMEVEPMSTTDAVGLENPGVMQDMIVKLDTIQEAYDVIVGKMDGFVAEAEMQKRENQLDADINYLQNRNMVVEGRLSQLEILNEEEDATWEAVKTEVATFLRQYQPPTVPTREELIQMLAPAVARLRAEFAEEFQKLEDGIQAEAELQERRLLSSLDPIQQTLLTPDVTSPDTVVHPVPNINGVESTS